MNTPRYICCTLAFALAACVAEAQVVCPAAPPPLPPPLAAVVDCGNPEFESCAINVGGIPRHFCIHVPSAPTTDLPVVFGFHGGGGQASVAVNWLDKHTEQGMILVAPTALPTGSDCDRHWRHIGAFRGSIPDWTALAAADATCTTAFGPWPAGSPNSADLDFTDALLNAIDGQFNVSGHYALGFSNGAGMVLQLLITEPLASRFDGYAMVANGITEEKRIAQTGGGVGPYSANLDARRPAMLVWGTADRTAFPAGEMIDRVNALAATAPPPAECVPPLDTPEKVVNCWMSTPMAPGLRKFSFVSRLADTRDWLVDFNNASPRAKESLYPDLGHSEAPPNEQDATLVARQDYPARPGASSEPIAVLTVLDGEHVMPGVNGRYAPCPAQNCDVNVVEEILQFWRAYASLRNRWP